MSDDNIVSRHYSPDRAFQRLAGAVLIQALQDASNGPRRYREEALEWIHGRAGAGFTFDFCCGLLGRSPQDVRRRLMRQNFIPKWDSSQGNYLQPSARADYYSSLIQPSNPESSSAENPDLDSDLDSGVSYHTSSWRVG